MHWRRSGLALFVLALLAVPVAGHVPGFADDNTSPERAIEVEDAVKSWSFYDHLHDGSVAYYRVSLEAGQRLRVGTFTPEQGAFTPSIVVMSESIEGTGAVPDAVEVPDGMGAEVIEGERPGQPSYEPFAPSVNYHTASVDRRVDSASTYLVAIYEPADRSGPAGVSIGYTESFTAVEYLTVPFDVVRTHLWEGQHPILAVGPFLATVVGGVALLWRRRRETLLSSPVRVALAGGGVLCLASGVNTLVQMGLALSRTGLTAGAAVTAVFVVAPAICGGWALSASLRESAVLQARTRLGLAVAGLVALGTWGGFLLGPALLVGVAVLPGRVAGGFDAAPS